MQVHKENECSRGKTHAHTHLGWYDGNLEALVLQNARAIGVEPDQVGERGELPPADEVVAAVGVDLEVVDVASAAEVRDGIVAWLSLALPHQVDALLSLHLLQPNTCIVATDTTVKPPG